MRQGSGPVTVVSCDNLASNGRRLEAAVREFADRAAPELQPWLDANTAFPETMVDCIVPATDAASRARVESALGVIDDASVEREPFAQWIIEDRFVSARPAWGAGVQFVADVADHRKLKLHVLNAAHSALAYLGRRRGHTFVREAIADPSLALRLHAMIAREVVPNLPDLPVFAYWCTTVERFANPMIDHRLDQIAQDGSAKLAERIYPLMRANLRAGRPITHMAEVVRAWLETAAPGGDLEQGLRSCALLPESFRAEPRLVAAVAEARP